MKFINRFTLAIFLFNTPQLIYGQDVAKKMIEEHYEQCVREVTGERLKTVHWKCICDKLIQNKSYKEHEFCGIYDKDYKEHLRNCHDNRSKLLSIVNEALSK